MFCRIFFQLHVGNCVLCMIRLYPGGVLGGADVDLLSVLSSRLGFGVRFKPERCWASVDDKFNIKEGCTLGSVRNLKVLLASLNLELICGKAQVLRRQSDLGIGDLLVNGNTFRFMDMTSITYPMAMRYRKLGNGTFQNA